MHIYLANDWVAHGFIVEFIVLRKEGELIPLLAPEIKITDLGVDRIRDAIIPLAVHFRRSDINVILVAMWPLTCVAVIANLIAFVKSRIYLIDHTQLSYFCKTQLNIPTYILKLSMRFTYPFANGVIAVSQGVKKDMCMLSALKDEYIKVIYNPASKGIIKNPDISKFCSELWGRDTCYKILSVGSLIPIKNHELLIRSFAQLQSSFNLKLVILGEGYLRGDLEVLINDLGLTDKIILPGFVINPYPWYLSADLFVLSSNSEGLPTVLIEALECGLPIVSTNCPSGPDEILEKGRYGKLVPVGDEYAMTQAITQSLIESHDHESLKNRAKDFSLQNISDQYLSYMFPKSM